MKAKVACPGGVVAVLTTLGVLFASSTFLHASAKIEEQIVGPAAEPGTIYTMSPRGLHLATVAPKGSRFVVTVDGVEGPPFDEILKAAGDVAVRNAGTPAAAVGYVWQGPVAFSPNGRRHAYAARAGKEIVVMLDGKEVFRAPHSMATVPVAALSFTPDGSRLLFYNQTSDTMHSHRLMIDGKPATPSFTGTPVPFFSPDGKRWGLYAGKPLPPHEPFLLIDGKDAGYAGARPQFTPDGKRVISIRHDAGPSKGSSPSICVDGKPILTVSSLHNINYIVSARGDIAAIGIMEGGMKRQLFINGKLAPAGDNVWEVVFSPDGKRWAAVCRDHPMNWVVVDGKKHQHYSQVSNVAFSPDSSTLVYVAESGVKKFIIINGEEVASGVHLVKPPFFAETGSRVAYVLKETPQGLGGHRAAISREPLKIAYGFRWFALSADGSRHAYSLAQDAVSTQLVVDGQVIGTGEQAQALFSADNRHVVAIANALDGKGRTLYLDGEYIPARDVGVDALVSLSPDGRHLLTRQRGSLPGGGGIVHIYRLNGQEVAQLAFGSVTWAGTPGREEWEVQPDGSIVLVGREPTPNRTFGPMKRVTVTPDKTASLASWGTKIKSDRERVIAEAEAAKAKAAADRLAAAAARKQAADEAAAARKKARADAAAARKKAADDAKTARAEKAKR